MLLCFILYAFASASILVYSTWCINANIWHGIRVTFLWPWFFVLTVYLRAICVFLGVFFAAFIFFGFLLLPSKLSDIVRPPLEVVQHYKTIVFLKLPSQSQTSLKRSSQSYQISRFHQASILSLRGGVRDILTH